MMSQGAYLLLRKADAKVTRDVYFAGPGIDAEWWSAELVLGNWPDPLLGSASVLRPWESRIYRRTGLG